MHWRVYPRGVQGHSSVVFKCVDQVVPFGVGVDAVEYGLSVLIDYGHMSRKRISLLKDAVNVGGEDGGSNGKKQFGFFFFLFLFVVSNLHS